MKNPKNILASVLAMGMLLSLAACGQGDKETDEETASSEYVYTAEYKNISGGEDGNYYPILFTDEGYYSTASEKVGDNVPEGVTPEYEGQYAVYENRLYFVDFDGNVKRLEKFAEIKLPDENSDKPEYTSSCYVNAMALNADGNLITYENGYARWYDGPENLNMQDDEYWENIQYKNYFFTRVLSPEGEEISCTPLDLSIGDAENYYINLLTPQGKLLGWDNSGNIVIFGLDGKLQSNVDVGCDWIDSAAAMKDGSIAVTYYDSEAGGERLKFINPDTGEVSEAHNLPQNVYNIQAGNEDYDFYYTNGTNFYGYDLESEKETKLFNWVNLDILSGGNGNVYFTNDGKILTISSDFDSDTETFTTDLITIYKVPAASLPQKEHITLGLQWGDYNLQNRVIKFNRSHDDVHIDIKDYSEYNTEEDYNAGKTKMLTEIMAGNAPDIFDLNQLPYRQLAAKGLLEDIYPYIDSDSEFSRKDFFPNILAGLEVNGKLCTTIPGFYIYTAAGSPKVVGDEPGWTFQEFDEALASMPEGCEPFSVTTTRDDILSKELSLNMDEFVDWTTGKCDFDNEDFIKILEFANRFPAGFDYQAYDSSRDFDSASRIQQGKQMLDMVMVSGVNDIFYNSITFGGAVTYIGYPTNSGTGNLYYPANGLAISAGSEHKDLCWQFLRQFMSEKYQSGRDFYYLPSNINAYNAKLKEAMTPEYQKDADGNILLDENGEKLMVSKGGYGAADGKVYNFYALSQEDADSLMQLITTTTKAYTADDSILEIVTEQSAAYFSGQKTAQDVAKLVQSKANIYVNEQR